MREQLTPLDAAFLEVEQADECSHMHIGWAMVFDPQPGGLTPSVEDVRDLLDRRLDAMPRFRKRLSHPRAGGLRWPCWEQDPYFDVAGARAPCDPARAGRRCRAAGLDGRLLLPPARPCPPLWEITLLDGLAAAAGAS